MSAPREPVVAPPTRPARTGRRARGPVAALAVAAALAGCANVPDLDARIPASVQSAPYPALLPLETALAPLPAPQDAAGQLETALAGRRDSLKARASRLQGPVVDDDSRARMAAGVAR